MISLVGLVWSVTSADDQPEKKVAKTAPRGLVSSETLGGNDRYLTHLSTDKPIYRPGETVYLRGVVLHHATHRPASKEHADWANVVIKGPKGERVAGGGAQVAHSVLGLRWKVPDSQAGGEYTINVTYPASGQPPAECKFDVRAYRAPRLKSQIKFLRDGYGPGDEAAARLHVERAEGGIPAGARVTVLARVDGRETYRGQTQIDDEGNCLARFPLPEVIERGEGNLSLVIEDGGVVETASKTIPILLQTVDLTMYPEGGDLVAGLPGRVYFEAFTPFGKPADLQGVVLNDDEEEVGKFRSEHEGRGRFEFTPQADRKYFLKIEQPSGITTRFPLPAVKPEGTIIRAESNVFTADEPVTVRVVSSHPQVVHLTVSHRESVIAEQAVKKASSTTGDGELVPISLPEDAPAGVLTVTAWDDNGKPLAERLVFRQPARAVQVELTADQPQYVPGGKVKVRIRTTDADGKPTPAVVGLTVSDDSVLEMIDKREQAPRLPVMVLLQDDVRDLADAHVYLDPNNEKAPLAVDLLLGVQGWRRFAFVRSEEFLAEHKDDARRLFALRLQTFKDVSGVAPTSGPFDPFGVRNRALANRFRGAIRKNARLPEPGAAAPEDGADFFEGDAGAEAPAAEAPPLPAQPGASIPKVAAEAKQDNRDLARKEGAGDGPVGGDRGDAQAAAAAPQPALADRAPRGEAAAGGQGPPAVKLEAESRRRLRQAFDAAADEDALIPAGSSSQLIAADDFVAVRVYAHQVRPNRKPDDRVDFAETLFWHAGLATDEMGEATFEFGLNDSVTSFRVFADAFNSQGGLGSEALQIESVKPFYLEPKLPLEVTMDDVILAPLGFVNATNAPLQGNLRLMVQAVSDLPTRDLDLSLPADGRVRKLLRVRVGKYSGAATFVGDATAGPYSDRVTRTMQVKPLGFPKQIAHGGLVGPGETASHEILVPDDVVRGSLTCKVAVYPSPLAQLTAALERLIREPSGCFEQTSSTTYPLVMAQQYFMSHEGVDPALIERSAGTLQRGYERLLGFESPSHGFEWFGGDPGHDALTAYGLMEFTDMAEVHAVDSAMLSRTRSWLLNQRDGKGGYARKTRTLHTWVTDPECANTYNTWALLTTGSGDELDREIKWVAEASRSMQNTYALALAANVLGLAEQQDEEARVLDQLAGHQQEDGSLQGATTSVVGSGGEALQIETTALATLAWLRDPRYADNVEKAIKYLAEVCKGGRFGSTQSTVLALKAIIAYDAQRAAPRAAGNLQLVVDGQPVGEPVAFSKDLHGALELPSLAKWLTPGSHTVALTMQDGSRMPYTMTCEFHAKTPDSSEACNLHLHAELRDEKLEEGSATEVEVAVVNRTGKSVPNPIAIIGIPGGLEVRHDQLKELVEEGKIAAYEVKGRELVLYWRSLDAEHRVELAASLIAAIPGSYTGPASRAYLYYTDEDKMWVEGLQVEVTPKR